MNTPKIDRAMFVREWCKDLRSGEYKQCQGQLHYGGRHCCLGVAELTGSRLGLRDDEDRTNQYLPGKWFLDLMGDDHPDVAVPDGEVPDEFVGASGVGVAILNDQCSWSFAKIADALEATYGATQ